MSPGSQWILNNVYTWLCISSLVTCKSALWQEKQSFSKCLCKQKGISKLEMEDAALLQRLPDIGHLVCFLLVLGSCCFFTVWAAYAFSVGLFFFFCCSFSLAILNNFYYLFILCFTLAGWLPAILFQFWKYPCTIWWFFWEVLYRRRATAVPCFPV